MTDKNLENDAVIHLGETENQAVELIKNATLESEKRLSMAQSEYNENYKSALAELNLNLEKQFEHKKDEIKNNYKKQLEDYMENISSKKKDEKTFASVVEKLVF